MGKNKIIHGEGSPSLRTEYGYLIHGGHVNNNPTKELLIKEVEKLVYQDRIIEKEVIIDRPIEVVVYQDKIIEKEIIVDRPVEVIIYKEKIIEKPVEIEKLVIQEKLIEKEVIVTKIQLKVPSWSKLLLSIETLIILLGASLCLQKIL